MVFRAGDRVRLLTAVGGLLDCVFGRGVGRLERRLLGAVGERRPFGWVAERLNAPVLKTGNGESRSWVQIPPHPFFWNGFFSAAEGLFLPWNDGSGGVGGGWLACRWRLRSSAPAHRNASARRTFPLSSSGAAGALTLEKPTRPRRQLQHLVRRLGVSRASHAAPAIGATRTRLAYRTCRCRTQACPWTPGRTATQPPAGDAVLGAVRPPRHGGG